MSTNFAKHVSAKQTPQTQVIPGREAEMARNNQGGFTFTLSSFDHLQRFLILGTEGGTYYSSEQKHTMQAFAALRQCIKENARQTVDMAVNVSIQGRAAKNDAALFTIACVMAFAETAEDKFYARSQLDKVARIGTHILHFAEFINQLKGWGTGTRKAFKTWFTDKTPDEIAFQYVKYGQRDGWSMRDILRKAHPTGTIAQNNVFHYIARQGQCEAPQDLPAILWAAEKAKHCSTKEVLELIKNYNLPREAIGTEHLNDIKVWEALLPKMGLTAIIRNLGKMTSIGLLKPLSSEAKFIANKLTNVDELRKARIHPVAALNAYKIYRMGRGLKGSLAWIPVGTISDALEDAFTKSFTTIEPSGQNLMLALDVSASMTWESSRIAGTALYAREASACMALVTAKTEQNYMITAFSNDITPVDITSKDSYETVISKISRLPACSTNCAAPMEYALRKSLDVDQFQVYTDNETAYGRIHPSQALAEYRKKMNKPRAKLAVVGMVATPFTIADPKDPFMMDFVGFDTNAPAAMAEFAKM